MHCSWAQLAQTWRATRGTEPKQAGHRPWVHCVRAVVPDRALVTLLENEPGGWCPSCGTHGTQASLCGVNMSPTLGGRHMHLCACSHTACALRQGTARHTEGVLTSSLVLDRALRVVSSSSFVELNVTSH
jgi:hypothetical protein